MRLGLVRPGYSILHSHCPLARVLGLLSFSDLFLKSPLFLFLFSLHSSLQPIASPSLLRPASFSSSIALLLKPNPPIFLLPVLILFHLFSLLFLCCLKTWFLLLLSSSSLVTSTFTLMTLPALNLLLSLSSSYL